MIKNKIRKLLNLSIFLSFFSALSFSASAFPNKPVELICSTKAGSGAAVWCEMMATEMSKEGRLGVPVTVLYKPGGSNHEGAVYTDSKKADGHTILHINGSHTGYFNLPHFTKKFEDFEMVAKVERHLYAIAVRCDDPEIKSWADLVKIEKANPGTLSMGSNKPGSIHHRQHSMINNDQGINMRFVPYQGTGGVVKDVVGNHLRVGFAQPGLWNKHIEAGVVCPIALLNETRLDHPLWKDVPTIGEVGAKYSIPHQFQGFVVKKGTPKDVMDKIAAAAKAVIDSDAYKAYTKKQPHVLPIFEDDRKSITDNFSRNLKDARKFMKDNGII